MTKTQFLSKFYVIATLNTDSRGTPYYTVIQLLYETKKNLKENSYGDLLYPFVGPLSQKKNKSQSPVSTS